MAQTRVMVDIETLGTEPGAAIVSIGAIPFDEDGIRADDGFYEEIDLVSCESWGLSIDADTLQWWLGQSDEAREVLTGGGGEDLAGVIADFATWFNDVDADEVWANSPSFDCRLLEAAFDAVGVDTPWDFWQERDFRTLKNLPAFVYVEREDGDVEHNAIDDAALQARAASKTLQSIEDL